MYKLSPSDFRYLWEDCKYCFYQKVKNSVILPSIGIPGVFMKMNSLLQNAIMGLNFKNINPDLPSGTIEVKEGYISSKLIPPDNKCYISGKFDVLSKLDDGTYSVVDFKISDPKEEKASKFRWQLHAYKQAIENPYKFGVTPKKISIMGVVIVAPETIEFKDGKIMFSSKPQWFQIKEDMNGFFDFIKEVTILLEGPLPSPTESCKWCQYRKKFNLK